MISFSDITKLFAFDLEKKACIEIEFLINGYPGYQSCWMGKTSDRINHEKDMYWFGLASDGSKPYDYDNFWDFSSSPVFDGKSLKQVWNDVTILSIDGCDPENRLKSYL